MEVKESAILVLGAISDSEGAYLSIKPHLTNLVVFLVNQLQSPEAMVRTTACWTLSKFSEWTSEQEEPFFKNYLGELLKRLMDQ